MLLPIVREGYGRRGQELAHNESSMGFKNSHGIEIEESDINQK